MSDAIHHLISYWKDITEHTCHQALPIGACLKCDLDAASHELDENIDLTEPPEVSVRKKANIEREQFILDWCNEREVSPMIRSNFDRAAMAWAAANCPPSNPAPPLEWPDSEGWWWCRSSREETINDEVCVEAYPNDREGFTIVYNRYHWEEEEGHPFQAYRWFKATIPVW